MAEKMIQENNSGIDVGNAVSVTTLALLSSLAFGKTSTSDKSMMFCCT